MSFRKILAGVAAAFAPAMGMGQDVTDQYGNEFAITSSPKVAAISYDSAATDHIKGTTGTQIARFTITLRCVKLASGWSDPGSIAMVNNQTVDPGGHPPATGWAGTQFNLLLTDTNGANFPGVQIQELFVPSDPPEAGFNTNKTGNKPPWVTQISPPGQSDATDMLTYLWYGTDQATRAFVHHYWAATASYGLGGIDMGAYTMTFLWGTPGTATQTH